MLVLEEAVLRHYWYPLASKQEVLEHPVSRRLLNQRIVLWWDGEQFSAVQDRCSHRSAKLSIGWIENGCLVCPYHGWNFNAAGKCVRMPQNSSLQPPRRTHLQQYRVQEKYGYIWVCLEEPRAGIPEFPEAENPEYRQIHEFFEEWNCAALRLMENSFDNSHNSFVHRQAFGILDEPAPPTVKITRFSDRLVMKTDLPVQNPDIQKSNLGIEGTRTVRHQVGTWYFPFTCKVHISYPNGLEHIIILNATPIDNDHMYLVQFALRKDSGIAVAASDEQIIAFDRQITTEDKLILESIEDPDVPLDVCAEFHMISDQHSIEMRKIFAEKIAEFNAEKHQHLSVV
jgi:phenylpropionate dioxygenase-like ring-hydroxylating dioxygenase large terminal subunit